MDNSYHQYSWAASLDSMEGTDVVNLPARPSATTAGRPANHPLGGVLLAIGVSLAALWMNALPCWPFSTTSAQGRVAHPIEPVMVALLLGMVVSNVWALPRSLQPGIRFSVKKLLPLGIVLLGARLNFG